jgi:hypothetical protein
MEGETIYFLHSLALRVEAIEAKRVPLFLERQPKENRDGNAKLGKRGSYPVKNVGCSFFQCSVRPESG